MSIDRALPLAAQELGWLFAHLSLVGMNIPSPKPWSASSAIAQIRYRCPPPASLPSHTSDHSISITDCAHSIIEILVPLRDQG